MSVEAGRVAEVTSTDHPVYRDVLGAQEVLRDLHEMKRVHPCGGVGAQHVRPRLLRLLRE